MSSNNSTTRLPLYVAESVFSRIFSLASDLQLQIPSSALARPLEQGDGDLGNGAQPESSNVPLCAGLELGNRFH